MRLPYLHASGGRAETLLFVYSLQATARKTRSFEQGCKDTKRLNNSKMQARSGKSTGGPRHQTKSPSGDTGRAFILTVCC